MATKKASFERIKRNLVALPSVIWWQRFSGFDVPVEPQFGSVEATAWFTNRLKSSRSYLEGGSGGSTIAAAAMKVPFVTVESDRFFLKAVEKAIHDRGLAGPSQEFRHADLGLTTAWGRPVFPQPLTTGMRQKFSRYSDLPVHVTQASEAPDLILVDGRFRVACALKFLLRFGRYENWWMAVDDFEVRDDYAVICNFAHLERLAGRMAIFKSSRKYRS